MRDHRLRLRMTAADEVAAARNSDTAAVAGELTLRSRPITYTPVHRWFPALARLSLVLGLLLSGAPFSSAQIAAGGGPVRLQYPNADVKDILAVYEQLTGKRIIYDNTLVGPVYIFVRPEVSRDEAIKIIETTLLVNGFSLVPAEGNLVKAFGVGKSPRTSGVPIISDASQLPADDRVVTFLFKLQYADPQEVSQVLLGGQLIQPSIYTGVVALPKSQTLLVTESTAVLRNLIKVVEEIDVPPAEVVSEFIKLERADAKDVIEKLEKIFEKPATPGGGTTAAGAPRPGAPAVRQTVTTTEIPPAAGAAEIPSVTIDAGARRDVPGLSEESIIVGKIKLTADIRTNRIHVVTRPINLPFVRRLIREFDSDVKFAEPAKRPLRFISAADVLDVVVKAITEPGAKAEDSGAAAAAPGGRSSVQPASNTTGDFSSGLGTSSTGSGGFNVSEGLSTEPVDTTPKAVTIGNTKIIADPRENTIIVLGTREVQQRVFTLLDELDVRAPQVMLNTVIGELRLRDQSDYGINYFLRDPTLRSTNVSGTNSVILPGGIGNTGNTPTTDLSSVLNALNSPGNLRDTLRIFTGGATGLQGIVASGDFGAIVTALESTGRFRTLQRPMVFTSNNKKAIIASGQEIAVPTQTLSNVVDNNVVNNATAAVSSSIQFKTVALQLEVVPLINSDREVALDILQKVDDVSGTTRIGGNDVPNITTRYIRTNVSVPNRATVVLGGLIRSQNDNSSNGVPLISRVPVIGYLFKGKSKVKERRELVILIRPVVTATPYETVDHSRTERRRLMIEPDVEATIEPLPSPPSPVSFRYKELREPH